MSPHFFLLPFVTPHDPEEEQNGVSCWDMAPSWNFAAGWEAVQLDQAKGFRFDPKIQSKKAKSGWSSEFLCTSGSGDPGISGG